MNWEGDLEDDCTLRIGEFMGRAECMGECIVRETNEKRGHTEEYWWCAVYRDKDGTPCGDQLFHSGEPGGTIHGGDMARKIVEAIIKAAMSGKLP